ncbi:MAG: lectin-like protein [Kofleriaceae bacterium]
MNATVVLALGMLAGCAFVGSSNVPPDASEPDAPPDAAVPQCASFQTIPGAPATSRYRQLAVSRTVAAQRTACGDEGGHLVVIDSAAEAAAVEAFAVTRGGFFWIGLGDAAVEGEWMTEKSQPAMYLAWDRTQPDGGVGESCVLQGMERFFDFRCDAEYPSVCECD